MLQSVGRGPEMAQGPPNPPKRLHSLCGCLVGGGFVWMGVSPLAALCVCLLTKEC